MRYSKGTFVLVPNKHVLAWQKPIIQCVYMRLCDFEKDWVCFPSVRKISTNAWCSERAVRDAINKLVSIWILAKAHNIKDNAYSSNTYHIMISDFSAAGGAGGYAGDAVGTAGGADRINPKEPTPTNSKYTKELEDFTNSWNTFKSIWKEKGLPQCRKITPAITEAYKKLRKQYSLEDFEFAVTNYLKAIERKKPWDQFYDHRYSLYDFLTNRYWFITYVNKWL